MLCISGNGFIMVASIFWIALIIYEFTAVKKKKKLLDSLIKEAARITDTSGSTNK